ncbi:T9SS type A sorting domain-containing protein [Algoriphagus namhaensis]
MRNRLILAFVCFLATSVGYAQTWTGAVNTNWNVGNNWSTGTAPGVNSDVIINSATATNQPQLPANVTIRNITISAGNLNLNNRTLTVTQNYRSTGGVVRNGTINATNFDQMSNTTFNTTSTEAITLNKTGGGNNTLDGGNTFNGATVILKNDNNFLRFAAVNGDTFNNTVRFQNNSTGVLSIAYSGSTTFQQSVTINNLDPNGQIRIGENGGTSVLNSGALLTTNFNVGAQLQINNFTQVQNTANGSFTVEDFIVNNSSFQGNFSVTTGDDLLFVGNNTFNGNNTFISGGNLDADGANQFSVPAGRSSSFTKNGNGNDDWEGGNTFGTVTFTNNSNNRLRLANSTGDSYLRTSVFNNNGNNFMGIAYAGTNSFAQQITINNTNAGGEVRFGEGGGTSTLATGGVVTTNFSVGNLLEFNNFTQVQNAANGTFSVEDFNVSNSVFLGNFAVTTNDDLIFIGNNTFNGTNSFISGGNLDADGQNQFSVPAGTSTTFVKNGNTNDDWQGGNTFGTVSFTNNSNNRLRLATVQGDTFIRTSQFNNNGNNFLGIAFNGTNTFAQQITINNTNAGGEVRFGEGGGTSTLSTGGVVTSSFSVGNLLEFNNFTQVQNVANGSFTVNTFTSVNSSFQGDFAATANQINFNLANTYARNGTFAGGRITMNAPGNNFATASGVARFTKTASTGNDDWWGGNTFGTLEVTNNSNSRLRLGNQTGDTFTSTSSFTNTGNNFLGIAFRGTNTFAQQITLVNTNPGGEIRFGEAGGTSTLQTGGVVTSNFNVGNILEFNNFTQVQNAPNGNFGVSNFNSNNSSFQGDFGVVATNAITFQNVNTYASNANFTAPDINANAGNNFATAGGIANFRKTGGGNNIWNGGNTFGIVNFINEDNDRFRLANNAGDTFLDDASFITTGSGLIEPAYNNTSTFAGDISTVGSSQAVTFGLGNGTVVINGSAAQIWRGDAARSPIVERLTMNSSGTLTMAVPLLVDIQATFTNGIINTDATNVISFDDGVGSPTGASDASHIDGPAVKLGNDNFEFPIGDQGFFGPLTIGGAGGAANSDRYISEYLFVGPVNIPTDTTSRDATIGLMNRNEHWTLNRTSGGLDRSITLSYDASRTSPLIDHTELVSIWWDGGVWRDLGGAVTGGPGSGRISAGTTSNLGFFSIGNSFRVLPVELLEFKAILTDTKQGLISWKTASERNNNFFTLEKSYDGSRWETIAILEGAGNSSEVLSYDFLDENLKYGRQFYRLTQTDFDGNSETFQVIGLSKTQAPNEDADFVLYPNPSQGKVKIRAFNVNLEDVTLSVFDTQGKEILTVTDWENTLQEIDLTQMDKGLYLFRFFSLKGVVIKKLILN